MRRRQPDQTSDAPVPPKSGRRSEAGDTLVEILIALTVLGVAATAILLAFATSISGSSAHRNSVTMDTMLRTAAAEVTSAIQQQSMTDFVNCSGAYVLTTTPGSIVLPNNPAPAVQYTASITGVGYWDTSTGLPQPQFTSPTAPTDAGCPSGVSSSVPGPQQLTITVTPSGGGASQTITTVVQDPAAPTPPSGCVNAQGQPTTATQLVWVQEPANGTAGSALYPPPTLSLEDASGCVETNDASAVHLAIDSYTPPPNSGLSAGTLSNCAANLGQGETSFTDCSLNTPGTYTLVATDPTDGLTSPQGDPFVISVGVPTKLAFQVEPGNGLGGQALTPNPTVWIEDSSGNVITGDSNPITLAIGMNPSNGTLKGCTSTTVNGVAQFSGCKIDKAGNGYTLAATDVGDNLTTPTDSTPFDVAVGPAAQLAFTTSPGGGVTGDKFGTQPLVTIQDLGGNTVTGNTSTVSLAIAANPGGGILSGCTEITTAGMAQFSGCSISKPGNGYTLEATDGTLQPAFSNPFNISAAVLTSFSVVPSTTTPTAGSAFSVTITALDQSGNTFPGLTGPQTIVFSGPANSPNGTKPIYPSPVTFTGGVATATNGVTLYDAQTTTLTATLTTAQGPVTGTSTNLTVSPPTAKTFTVSGFPNPTVAGASGSVTVTADDGTATSPPATGVPSSSAAAIQRPSCLPTTPLLRRTPGPTPSPTG